MLLLLVLFLCALCLEATDWSPCANHLGTCSTIYEHSLFRYGDGSKWFYEVTTGYLGVPCNHWFFGDAFPGVFKRCDVASFDPTDNSMFWPSSWTKVASHGQEWNVQNQGNCTARWVRYGLGTRWFYKLMTGRFWCLVDWFGGDPISGVLKECQVGNTCVDYGKRQLCAPYGFECQMSSNSPYYVIQMEGTSEPKRGILKLSSNPVVKCLIGYAVSLDIDQYYAKNCFYYPSYTINFRPGVGAWNLVVSGGSPTYELQEGVTRSNNKEVTTAWGTSLKASIEAGYTFGGASVSTTVEASIWASEAQSYSETVTRSLTRTCSSSCPANYPFIYQWGLTIPEACSINDWTCNAQLFTCHFRCRATATPPRCPYFKCCDEQCDRCSDSYGRC